MVAAHAAVVPTVAARVAAAALMVAHAAAAVPTVVAARTAVAAPMVEAAHTAVVVHRAVAVIVANREHPLNSHTSFYLNTFLKF